ncbi:hypothetical protein M1116_04170 [Patescibacteria group bacterium]|nr:hypothetical protein [Patescibacteria group bacterium]
MSNSERESSGIPVHVKQRFRERRMDGKWGVVELREHDYIDLTFTFLPAHIGQLHVLEERAGTKAEAFEVVTSHRFSEQRPPHYQARVEISCRDANNMRHILVDKATTEYWRYTLWEKPEGWIESSDLLPIPRRRE